MQPADAAAPRFTIEIETQPDRVVAHCRGLLVAGLTEILHAEVKPLLAANRRVVLDLTGLTRLDSMGLGAIISLAVSAKRAGCEFELVNLGKQIRQLFAITNLLTLFESAGDNTFRII
jgi:anti-sigma B factor antagonist